MGRNCVTCGEPSRDKTCPRCRQRKSRERARREKQLAGAHRPGLYPRRWWWSSRDGHPERRQGDPYPKHAAPLTRQLDHTVTTDLGATKRSRIAGEPLLPKRYFQQLERARERMNSFPSHHAKCACHFCESRRRGDPFVDATDLERQRAREWAEIIEKATAEREHENTMLDREIDKELYFIRSAAQEASNATTEVENRLERLQDLLSHRYSGHPDPAVAAEIERLEKVFATS